MTREIEPRIILGKIAVITKAKNKSLEGLSGKIIEETKSTFVLDTAEGKKRILKSHIEKIKFPEESIEIDAALIQKREKKRIKQKFYKKK